jgi:uncharacterized integral membrane protein
VDGEEHTPAEPAPPEPAPAAPVPAQPVAAAVPSAIAHEEQALVAEERKSPWRFWVGVAAVLLVVGYTLAFVVANTRSISVDFVFASAHITLIWTILLLLVIGFVGGWFASHLYRQRRGKKPRKP